MKIQTFLNFFCIFDTFAVCPARIFQLPSSQPLRLKAVLFLLKFENIRPSDVAYLVIKQDALNTSI
jgi:hypothetical protein